MTLRDYAQLFKLPISAMSTLSAATGFVAFTHTAPWRLPIVASMVLLLACAASALNEVQEHKLDAQMARTRRRPIPAGKLSPARAATIALTLAALALVGLYRFGGLLAAGLGAFAVVWYNGIYTPLKRVSSTASMIGSVIGTVPPAIGWVSAGGELQSPILAFSFFMLMWQVPHFWLLALNLNGDYESARFPTFERALGRGSLARVTFMWTAATAASALLVPLFGLSSSPFLGLGLAIAGAWLVVVAWRALHKPSKRGVRQAFFAMNYYALAVMAAVIVDAMLVR